MFLRIEFGDNDYSLIMTTALKRLWGYVNKNNGHITYVRTLTEMFVQLHESGSLENMIQQLFELEYLCSEVEHATRGLYFDNVDWSKKCFSDYKGYYLECNTTLHESNTFTDENGECAWLNLKTGECESY